MSSRTTGWIGPYLAGALMVALFSLAPALGAGGDEAVYKILQIYGLGSVDIDPKTQGVEGGIDLPGVDEIGDDAILDSPVLHTAIRRYFKGRGVVHRKNLFSISVIEEIIDAKMLARSGNRANLRIDYFWIAIDQPNVSGNDTAEVLVEIIPSFSNETYGRERYGAALTVEDSYFADIAREVAALGLKPGKDDRECQHNYHSPNPCIESIALFERFIEQHGIEKSVNAAYMFQAFVRGEYGRADRIYAHAKGYTLPKYEGIGTEIAALGLRDHMNGGNNYPRCDYNYYSPNPCPGVIRLWQDFAERHGVGLSRASADMFEAYVEGNYRRGDRLYRAATGIAEADYVGPGVAVMALGLDPSFDLDRECRHDPTSPNRCVTSIVQLEEFAAEHGLPLDFNTAEMFQAYVRQDTDKGDKMYARAKDIPLEAVRDPDYVPEEPPWLIIDIIPGDVMTMP